MIKSYASKLSPISIQPTALSESKAGNYMQTQITLSNQQLESLALLVASHLSRTSPAKPEEWLVTKQAAELMQVSVSRMAMMTREKLVPSHKFGRSRRYKRSELLAVSSAAGQPPSSKEKPSAGTGQIVRPKVPHDLPELHPMWQRPFSLALDTFHVADGKWHCHSYGSLVPVLDLASDPDGSRSVTMVHKCFFLKGAGKSSEPADESNAGGD